MALVMQGTTGFVYDKSTKASAPARGIRKDIKNYGAEDRGR